MPILVWQFCITFTMEDLDSRLFIADVEVSCWQDQLRQAVSIYFTLNSKLSFLKKMFFFSWIINIKYQLIFHFGSLQILITHDQTFIMPNFTLQGFAETILTPLQASSVLIKVDR